jgi:hypothetical protein
MWRVSRLNGRCNVITSLVRIIVERRVKRTHAVAALMRGYQHAHAERDRPPKRTIADHAERRDHQVADWIESLPPKYDLTATALEF